MALIGFYAGSFDPITNGHLDIIQRAAKICDRLILGIGVHPAKNHLFSPQKRAELLKDACLHIQVVTGREIEITHYDTLTVEAAVKAGANIIIRGLRNSSDFDYEMQMSGMNNQLSEQVETLFLAASPGTCHITATLVRQIAALGGQTNAFVPALVVQALKEKYALSAND